MRGRRGRLETRLRRRTYHAGTLVPAGLLMMVLGVVAAILLQSATGSTRRPTHPAFAVLGDTSLDSTPETRQRAQRLLTLVAEQAREQQGFVSAAAFQEAPLSRSDWHSVGFDPPAYLWNNGNGTRDWITHEFELFTASTARIFLQPRAVPGTDLLGILLAAVEELGTRSDATSRTIILASNMVNVGPDLGLKAHVLSPIEVKRTVARLQEQGLVARLEGVCVYVVGAGQIPNESIPNSIQLSIRRFWRAYFTAAGARFMGWSSSLSSPIGCEA